MPKVVLRQKRLPIDKRHNPRGDEHVRRPQRAHHRQRCDEPDGYQHRGPERHHRRGAGQY